jgi:hypothetical protein
MGIIPSIRNLIEKRNQAKEEEPTPAQTNEEEIERQTEIHGELNSEKEEEMSFSGGMPMNARDLAELFSQVITKDKIEGVSFSVDDDLKRRERIRKLLQTLYAFITKEVALSNLNDFDISISVFTRFRLVEYSMFNGWYEQASLDFYDIVVLLQAKRSRGGFQQNKFGTLRRERVNMSSDTDNWGKKG